MKHFEIKGTIRETGPKAVVKAYRKQGLVPCNLYGHGLGENIIFTVTEKDLRGLLYTPFTYIADIVLDNGKKYEAVICELQFHPVTGNCLHVDFLFIHEEKPVTVMIPIKVTGHAAGVKAGGHFLLYDRKLKVSGLAKNLPDEIEVDITPLKINEHLTVADLKVEGFTILAPKDQKVCGVRSSRNVVDTTAEAAPAEGAGDAAAPAAPAAETKAE